MPIIFVDANPRMVAYVVQDGGSGYQELESDYPIMEAEYIAVLYGLNEFFLKWNSELDSRFSDLDPETKNFVDRVNTPSDRTARPLPPPIMVRSDNEVVVKQLSRQYHIGNARLRQLAQQVWQITKNLDVTFEWVSRKDNIAGKMLK